MSGFLPMALAAVIFGEGIPTAKRIASLASHFDPPPGSVVVLDSPEMRDYGSGSRVAVEPGKLRGHIRIKPPRGQCFTLRSSPDIPDESICKPRDLVFTIEDIDRAGRLHWTVITGEGDFGTTLTWQTPYRLAIAEPAASKPEDPPQYLFVEKCEVDKETSLGRRVRVRLFGGQEWSMRLPEEDALLPQPDPVPNLYIEVGRPKGGISADSSTSKKGQGDAPEKEDHGEATKAEGHNAEAGHGDSSTADVPEIPKAEDPLDDRKSWSIPTRDSYALDGSLFSTGIAVHRGVEGKCRYSFRGSDDDPNTGRVECHDVPGFRMLLVPLTCMAKLKPQGSRRVSR